MQEKYILCCRCFCGSTVDILAFPNLLSVFGNCTCARKWDHFSLLNCNILAFMLVMSLLWTLIACWQGRNKAIYDENRVQSVYVLYGDTNILLSPAILLLCFFNSTLHGYKIAKRYSLFSHNIYFIFRSCVMTSFSSQSLQNEKP